MNVLRQCLALALVTSLLTFAGCKNKPSAPDSVAEPTPNPPPTSTPDTTAQPQDQTSTAGDGASLTAGDGASVEPPADTVSAASVDVFSEYDMAVLAVDIVLAVEASDIGRGATNLGASSNDVAAATNLDATANVAPSDTTSPPVASTSDASTTAGTDAGLAASDSGTVDAAATEDVPPATASDTATRPATPIDAVASRKVFDEFSTFVKDGNFEKGIQLLEEWLKQSPMDLVNRQNLIHVLLKLERFEQAVPHLSFMVDEASDPGEWLGHFGRTLARLGEYARAAQVLSRAVDVLPEDIDLRLDLARIHATRKDYAAARAVLQDALKLEKKVSDVLKELAAVLVELGEYVEAAKRYRQLQRLQPTYETALTMAKIASQYERCDDVVDALADWEKDFADESPHLLLGACALKSKERVSAQKHFLLGLKANPKCYYCALWMGDVHFELQDWSNAVKYYAVAAPVNPRDYRAFHQLGKALANQGEHIRAARALQKADERKPNDVEILYALGMELLRAGERKDAWDVWAKLEPLDRAKANEIKALLVQ